MDMIFYPVGNGWDGRGSGFGDWVFSIGYKNGDGQVWEWFDENGDQIGNNYFYGIEASYNTSGGKKNGFGYGERTVTRKSLNNI